MKKAVLREDLMAVTKDLTQSMVLSQMLYWTKTLDQVNQLIFEENKRLAEESQPQCEYNYGWIWKSAREMREDLMMAFTEDSIQKAFSALSACGLLMKRNNPKVRYDRKLQYRVDLLLLRRKLKECGWAMTDFVLSDTYSEIETIPPITECIPPITEWKPPIAESIPPNTETITETTNKITTHTLPPNPLKGAVSAKVSSVVENKATDSEFESFYLSYPRKVAKPQAKKAWSKNKCVLAEVLPALEQHKKTWKDPQFIPHPATWLNQRRWEDETIVKQESTFQQPTNSPVETIKNNEWVDDFWTWLHQEQGRTDIERDYLGSVEDRWLVEFIKSKQELF
jgi:hypothetical protein